MRSTTVQINCDQCNTLKGETNHWYQIGEEQCRGEHSPRMFILPYSETVLREAVDLCGASCVLKYLSKKLETFGK